MNKRSIEAGQGHVTIGLRNRIGQGAKAVQKDLDGLSRRFVKFGGGMVGLSGAVLAPMLAATKGFAATGDELDKMSARVGVSVESLSGLAFAAEQSGADLGSVERGFRGMSRALLNLQTGSASAVDAFGRIGLSMADLAGLSPEDQMMTIADALNTVGDASTKAALAQRIFGRAGTDLLPMLSAGSEGIKALKTEAGELGRTLSTEDATSAAKFTDAMNRVKSVTKGVVTQVGAALAPALTTIADVVSGATKGFVAFAKENRGTILAVAGIAAAVGAAGAAIVGIGGLFAAASVAVGGLISAVSFLVSPIGIAAAAVAGLGFAIFKYTSLGGQSLNWLVDQFGPLVQTAKDALAGITAAIQAGDMEAAWKLLTELMNVAWEVMTGKLRDTWNAVVMAVLDAGTAMTKGIGMAIEGLANALDALLTKYRSVYDSIHGTVTDAMIGDDVRTIGAKSSAYDANFGGITKSLRGGIDQVREYGKTLRDSAELAKQARHAESEAAKRERDKRIAELRAQLSQSSKDAVANAEEKKSKDAGRNANPGFRLTDADLGTDSLSSDVQGGMDRSQPQGPGATFSAFGAVISALGPGGSAADRTAKASEESAALLKKIADNLGAGRPRDPVGGHHIGVNGQAAAIGAMAPGGFVGAIQAGMNSAIGMQAGQELAATPSKGDAAAADNESKGYLKKIAEATEKQFEWSKRAKMIGHFA